jgi:5-methylcytosine-specific restriction endonuclease McrA
LGWGFDNFLKSSSRFVKVDMVLCLGDNVSHSLYPLMSTPVDRKAKVPRAVREQVWLTSVGAKYEAKCGVRWCTNKMNVFDFHVGHNIPESKGGTLDIKNLQAICSRCNLSMGNQYSIDEWNNMSKVAATGCLCFR